MILRTAWRGHQRLLGGAVVVLLCAGCATNRSNQIDPDRIKISDDIVKIIQFWPQTPWLQDGDRIVGFKATIYFVSGRTEKGVFVPGDIFVWVYELKPTGAGGRERKLAHMWEFNDAEASGFQVSKRSIMGDHYGFPLKWPLETTLEGKLVEIQFGYERSDKQLVLSSARRFRVPVPIGYQPPANRMEP